ncbi:MAG TPA: FHA domain-containing protein [Arthrobacter sp.]|nr:FHA domain-containing protein [Arthrobacter sp.]
MMPSKPAAATRYTPGSWLGVVRSGTVVLLRPDSAAELVESVWELLGTGPGVHEVLDAVTSASGGSLARLPWFAIVHRRLAVQFFLRGEIDLTVDLPAGPVELSGRDVTTWTERRFATADGFRLTIPGEEGAAGAGPDLPLSDGVVRLQGLRVDFTGAAGPQISTALPAVVALPSVVAVPSPGTASEFGARDDAPAGQAATRDDVLAAESAIRDDVLAAAEADIAAELHDHGVSAETVLDFPGEDPELNGTLHEEPESEQEPEPEPEPAPEQEPDQVSEGADPDPAAPQPPAAPEPAEQEPTGSYDHLWEQTVMRSIEDAAVREDPDADPDAGPAVGPAAGAAGDPAHGSESPQSADTGLSGPEPAAPETAPAEAAPVPAPPAIPTGLIDSVPWRTGGSSLPSSPQQPIAPAAPLPPTAPQARAAQATSPQATVRPLPAAQPGADEDHDGQTIMKSELAGAAAPPSGRRSGAEPATGPMVLARVCPQGHANPSTYSQCGRCGEPLPGDGVQVRRPHLGRMRLSSGELIDLDQSLIVGRQPSVSRVQGAVMPKLVQVASPSGDISRSHVEVRLEGWHVMLCDLKATNGTVLVREGQPPRRLAQGEMAILLDGDIAEVGDGISLRFEEIP